ncbi:MAG TPA: hypothetical protein VFX20_09405 [Steroidobacteraceae bacterium]|nr:hypothetical protein [Steroidobacteraceae bacterium]
MYARQLERHHRTFHDFTTWQLLAVVAEGDIVLSTSPVRIANRDATMHIAERQLAVAVNEGKLGGSPFAPPRMRVHSLEGCAGKSA